MINKQILISKIISFLNETGHSFSYTINENKSISGFSSLFNYKEGTMTFVSSLNKFRDYKEKFIDISIDLIIVDPSESEYDCFDNVIKIENPKRVFFLIIEEFFSYGVDNEIKELDLNRDTSNCCFSYISPKATIGKNIRIGKGCVIEGNVIVGDNTVIHHNVVLRNGTKIGRNCVILSGTVIGERGFNPLKTSDGNRKLVKHYGGVEIGDYVEIGENCSISKGTIDNTIIENNVKINKSACIAHNVRIKKGTVITSPIFIAGSVIIGENCHIAALVIRNQCKIGDNSILGLGSIVIKDVPEGMTVVGNPAKELIK